MGVSEHRPSTLTARHGLQSGAVQDPTLGKGPWLCYPRPYRMAEGLGSPRHARRLPSRQDHGMWADDPRPSIGPRRL